MLESTAQWKEFQRRHVEASLRLRDCQLPDLGFEANPLARIREELFAVNLTAKSLERLLARVDFQYYGDRHTSRILRLALAALRRHCPSRTP